VERLSGKARKSRVKLSTFKCGVCDGVFEMARTDEEAKAEYEATFGGLNDPDPGVVCDDCYEKMNKILPVEEFMRRFN
jgi:hypothetical protein